MMILPESTHARLRGGPVLRWGILAPGKIAAIWAGAVHRHTDQRIVAVASRSVERAGAFASSYGIPHAYSDYGRLIDDPAVDAVYIAAPHSEHLPLALRAIAGGKHVLVEKPAGINATQARELAAAGRAAGVFVMEAMWSRFLPQTIVLDQLARGGSLGEVLTVAADFGERFPVDLSSRAYDPALGGGALLDVGIYPIWFARMLLGDPSEVVARGSLAMTGVDAHVSIILDYATRAQAMLSTSILVGTPLAASVSGTEARVEYTGRYFGASGFRVLRGDETIAHYEDPSGMPWHDGICYQTAAMAADVAEGRTESSLHSLDDTVAVLDIIDEASRQVHASSINRRER